MIFDSQLMYSDDQSVIATAYSDNVIPMPDDVDNVALHLICTEVVGADTPSLLRWRQARTTCLAHRLALVKLQGSALSAHVSVVPMSTATRLTYTVGGALHRSPSRAALVTGEQSNALYPDGNLTCSHSQPRMMEFLRRDLKRTIAHVVDKVCGTGFRLRIPLCRRPAPERRLL